MSRPDLPPPNDDAGFADERPSKTQRKKASHELQDLGEALVALPESRVQALDIPEGLRDAVHEYRRTRSHEGRRRQMQYIGKLMRQTDAEPIREAVAAFTLGHARDSLALHRAEQWRAELFSDDEALARWAGTHPRSDVQRLRSLIRAARKEGAPAAGVRHGRAWRELFQFIRESVDESPASHE